MPKRNINIIERLKIGNLPNEIKIKIRKIKNPPDKGILVESNNF